MARIFIILTLLLSIDGMARQVKGPKPARREADRSEVKKSAVERRDTNIRKDTDRDVLRTANTIRVLKVTKDDGSEEEVQCCACEQPVPAP